MQQGQDFKHVVYRMAEASQPHKRPWLKLRETLGTMILGTVSTSIGVVVLLIGLQGVLGFGHSQWHDASHGMAVPSEPLAIASIVGESMGLAGLAVGKMFGGAISPLSAVGTVVCLIQMYIFFGQFLLINIY